MDVEPNIDFTPKMDGLQWKTLFLMDDLGVKPIWVLNQ